MTKQTFLGLNVRRHPWLAGQLWAALVCFALVVFELLKGQRAPLASIPALVGIGLIGGLAFGAVLSVIAKSAANREGR